MERLPRLVELERHRLATIEIADNPSRDAERVRVGLCVVVGYSRHIGAAGGAASHDHGDLRNPHRRQIRLIVEDAAEVLAVREDLVLAWQMRAAGIDEIDAGEVVLPRDLLGAQMLLHRHRKIGAALDGRVIGDDHAFLAMDLPDAGDDSGGDDVLAIEAVTGELRELEEGRAEVEQGAHAIARQELAACEMTLPRLGPTALLDALHLPLQIIDELPHRRGVALELLRSRVDR